MKARATIGAVLALLLLTGCGDAAGPGDAPPSGGGSTSSGSGEVPTELPTDLRECPPADKNDDVARVPDTLANVDYDVPDGFTTAGTAGLAQIQTAEGEDLEDDYYLLEVAEGVENLALVHYRTLANGPVADACGRLDVDEVLARLAEHNTLSGSQVTLAPELIDVDGAPTLVEERTYPEVGITVVHYWIYGLADMLNVQCQWTSHEQELRAGCEELIHSLRVA